MSGLSQLQPFAIVGGALQQEHRHLEFVANLKQLVVIALQLTDKVPVPKSVTRSFKF